MDLIHKCIVLTGAASGIGLALMERLADQPVQLLAVDVNAAALEVACDRLAGSQAAITPLVCDLSCQTSLDQLFVQAVSRLGKIDLFIANAGFAYYECIETPDWDHLERIFRVNVFNTLYTIEKMKSLNSDQPYKVVVTASAMAHIGVPGYALYSATKAALDRFADAYRWQMQNPRQLMLVYPIGTRTGFFQTAGRDVPFAWPTQSPEQVAASILSGIRRDRGRVYPSILFRMVLFFDRFLPVHRAEQAIEQHRFQTWLKRGGS
jgi:short-subunit dehydrogenase